MIAARYGEESGGGILSWHGMIEWADEGEKCLCDKIGFDDLRVCDSHGLCQLDFVFCGLDGGK
jgi:hypothetical protein